MSTLTTELRPPAEAGTQPSQAESASPIRPVPGAAILDVLRPNVLVRWAFYVSIFSIPFTRVYLPGTGDRIGVTRLVQALMLCAVLSQPRVCLRLLPMALLWMLAYCAMRLASGLWLTPELSGTWWPSTLAWLQFSLPWVWVAFNVLQFPGMGRNGLLALIAGCSLCALLHLAGIGVVEIAHGVEGRSSVFGENANVAGVMYALAAIGLVGFGMSGEFKPYQRLLLLPWIAVLAAGLAKTGSRTAVLVLGMGILTLLFQGGTLGTKIKRFAALLVVVAVLAAVASRIPGVVQRFEKLDTTRIAAQESRVRMMPVLWEIFLRNPIGGSGPDDYQFELTRRAMPQVLRDQRMMSAHNLALKLLVETGVVGFLLFSMGIGAALVSAWRARLKPCGWLPLAMMLPLAIAGIVLSDPSYHLVFWFAFAYALAGTV